MPPTMLVLQVSCQVAGDGGNMGQVEHAWDFVSKIGSHLFSESIFDYHALLQVEWLMTWMLFLHSTPAHRR